MRNRPASKDGKLRVVLWGLGALGTQVMKAFAAGVPDIRILGIVDHAPHLAGKKASDVNAEAKALGLDFVIQPTIEAGLDALKEPVDVVYHMTESVLSAIEGQLTLLLDRGIDVISASEAMFYPNMRAPEFSARIDAVAKRNGVAITGVGINPGFVFDALVLTLARITTAVKSVRIQRCIDVYGTGAHDIDHVGYGLTPEDFRAKIASGRIVGHMGMPDSIALVAERLGMSIDRIEESWDIETADYPVDSGAPALGILPPGRVIGITQHGFGYEGNVEKIRMDLAMYYSPEKFGLTESDDIVIDGSHRVHCALTPAAVSIQGAGLHIANTTHDIVAAKPGLVNMMDFGMGGRPRGMFRYKLDPKKAPEPGKTWLVKAPL
jgi:4-hydroxy-tetrahydrodipicolinate reductase